LKLRDENMDGLTGVGVEGLAVTAQAAELGRAGETSINSPARAAIPRSEGIHLEIKNGLGEKPWTESDPKTLLKDCFVAIATAKAVAEGRFTPEQWVNIHLSARPDFNEGVNVFGRNPESVTGWGKPVQFGDSGEAQLSAAEAQDLKHLFTRYLPLWEKTMPRVNLFAGGVNALSPDSVEFQGEAKKCGSSNTTLLWMNEKFNLVAINAPHLNGLHLVVDGRDSYWKARGGFKRPWQNQFQQDSRQTDLSQITGFLEAEAILIGAERVLLQEGKLPYYHPEVHFSSNWASGLRPVEEGGKLDTAYLASVGKFEGAGIKERRKFMQARKNEKRKHRVGEDEEWGMGTHGHLYVTRDMNTYVTLPSRPQAEVPNQWEGIAPFGNDEGIKIRELAQRNLTTWLTVNTTGGLSTALVNQ
jgi:hypothetical protein